MNYKSRNDLEKIIHDQNAEIEKLSEQNEWLRSNATTLIERSNDLLIQNKEFKRQIAEYQKLMNIGGPIETYHEAFVKNKAWHEPSPKSIKLLGSVLKRNQDRTVRLTVNEAENYIIKELS